jgi:hypothetical protein
MAGGEYDGVYEYRYFYIIVCSFHVYRFRDRKEIYDGWAGNIVLSETQKDDTEKKIGW